MNERHRVELLLPLIAILDVVENGVQAAAHPETLACVGATKAAMDTIMADVRPDDVMKCLRRVRRAHEMGLGRFKNEAARLDVYSYGLYYMLKVLTDNDMLVLGQDNYRDAVDRFLAALSKSELDEIAARRAKSQGRMMLQTYQALGYYARVPWPADDHA